MPHIDEGNLNALLDGALAGGEAAALREHLLLCANCRTRLDEAEHIRDQADAILAGALPVAATPPDFEEILARARAVGPQAPPRSSAPARLTTPRTLAWAASLVLALAGGWWAHELTLGPALRSGPLERVTARPGADAARAAEAAATRLSTPAPSTHAPGSPASTADLARRAQTPTDRAAAASGVAGLAQAPAGRTQRGAPANVAAVAPLAGPGTEAAPAAEPRAPTVVGAAPAPGAAAPTEAAAPAPADVALRGFAAKVAADQAKATDAAGAKRAEAPAARSLMMQDAISVAPAPRAAAEGSAGAPPPSGLYAGESYTRDLLARSWEVTPTFMPYTVAPELLNRDESARALAREYPLEARETGRGGRPFLWLLVDTTGLVRRVLVKTSSGDLAIDAAAVRVARGFRFTPALNVNRRVPVWVSLPVTFRPGDNSLPADSQSWIKPATPADAPARRTDVRNPGSPR